MDVDVAADILAAALGVQQDVVALCGEVLVLLTAHDPFHMAGARRGGDAVRRAFAVPECVEVQRVFRQGLDLLVIDVEIEVQRAAAFVLHGEAGAPAERHRKPAVEAAAVLRCDLQGSTGKALCDAVAHAEKVAERRLDARLRFVVPVDIQHDLADIEFLRADAALRAAFVRVADGAEKVRDDAGTLQVGEEIRLAGGNEDIVVIAARWVAGGDTHALACALDKEIFKICRLIFAHDR